MGILVYVQHMHRIQSGAITLGKLIGRSDCIACMHLKHMMHPALCFECFHGRPPFVRLVKVTGSFDFLLWYEESVRT